MCNLSEAATARVEQALVNKTSVMSTALPTLPLVAIVYTNTAANINKVIFLTFSFLKSVMQKLNLIHLILFVILRIVKRVRIKFSNTK